MNWSGWCCGIRGTYAAARRLLSILSAGAVWMLASNSASLGDLVTFDTSDEFTRFFAETTLAPGDVYVWSDGPGVGGVPGRVDIGVYSADALVYQRPLGWGASGSLWGQSFFYYDSGKIDLARRTNEIVVLGLLDSQTSTFTLGRGVTYVAVALIVGDAGRQLALVSRGSRTVYSPEFALSSGWCSLSGTWARREGDVIDYVARLFSYGETGTGPGTEVASFAGTMRNIDIAMDEELFFGLDGGGWLTPYFDNVSVIPEPSALGLALLGGLAVCSRHRCAQRRKRLGRFGIAFEKS